MRYRRFIHTECHLVHLGIPTISEAQQITTSRYLNLTTIAVFMAGLTASIMSTSPLNTTDKVDTVAISTFFASLVFGVSSAILSLTAMTWKKSIVFVFIPHSLFLLSFFDSCANFRRKPCYHLPPWAYSLFDSSPMISLFLSVGLFAIGLCFLAFSSGQVSHCQRNLPFILILIASYPEHGDFLNNNLLFELRCAHDNRSSIMVPRRTMELQLSSQTGGTAPSG